MDPDNPIVALCAAGMRAEAAGRTEDAHARFAEAWDAARDDYEACVAAHYLARHQRTPEDRRYWNAECLARADVVGDERVHGFYPSLHLNLARDHAELGDAARPRGHYERAAAHLDALPPGPYGDWTRYAVVAGLREPGTRPGRAAVCAPRPDGACPAPARVRGGRPGAPGYGPAAAARLPGSPGGGARAHPGGASLVHVRNSVLASGGDQRIDFTYVDDAVRGVPNYGERFSWLWSEIRSPQLGVSRPEAGWPPPWFMGPSALGAGSARADDRRVPARLGEGARPGDPPDRYRGRSRWDG